MMSLKKTKLSTIKKIVIAVVVTGAVVVVGVFAAQQASLYRAAADQANIVSIRELVLLAVRGVKKDAPVEAHSGDVYFPESKLYLPNPGTALPLTYLFDTGDIANSMGELSVSTYPVRGTEALYSASNIDELFEAVPKLQACSRGIKLVHQKFPSDDEQNILKHTVRLNNGKTIYVYLEKDCPQLGETADLFKNIRAY